MKTLLIILTIFCFAACQKDDEATGPQLEAQAMLHTSSLAVDGCDTHVALNWNDPQKEIRYAPDEESVALIYDYVGNRVNEWQKQGTITYQLTGRRKTVQCGWGAKFEADEIKLLSVR